MKQNPDLELGAETVTPELQAYYDNRPLMWRNLVLILLLNLGWGVSFTVVPLLIQLRLNAAGVAESGLGLMGAINFWVYSYAVMYFAEERSHCIALRPPHPLSFYLGARHRRVNHTISVDRLEMGVGCFCSLANVLHGHQSRHHSAFEHRPHAASVTGKDQRLRPPLS